MIEQSAYRGFGLPDRRIEAIEGALSLSASTDLSLPISGNRREQRIRKGECESRGGGGLNTRGGPWALGCWLAASLGFKFRDTDRGQSCSWVSSIGPKTYGLSGGPTREM